MKTRMTIMAAVIIALSLMVGGCGNEGEMESFVPVTSSAVDAPAEPPKEAVSAEHVSTGRAYRTQLKGGGEDVVTLMVYLCGSNLESEGAAASADLIEILEARTNKNLKIVVETGGANKWAAPAIDPALNQRWLVTDNDLRLLESMEARNMSEGSTLSSFISYSAENYPADRYMLVLWDHGGGTLDGYAYDERFGNTSMMTIAELDEALETAGVMFDMIGFDCCLMSTIETAFMVEKYADYMVASQRVEPGSGWHYTPWVSALADDTSMPAAELGKLIVDSFIMESKGGYYGHELTLSVTDLTRIPGLFDALYTFFSEAQADLAGDMFVSTSHALSGSRAMQDKYDLVDMGFLIESMDGSEEVLNKLKQCVVYNGATIDNHNGLCLYFPYTDLDKAEDALKIYDQIGIDDRYKGFIAAFANMMLGGQVYNGGGSLNTVMGGGFDMSGWLNAEWADEEEWADLSGFYEENSYDGPELLPIEEIDGSYVLTMSEEDWALMNTAELWVFIDDGEGYIDLGRDPRFDFDGTNLYIDFDNSWVALDGQVVCFFSIEYVYENDDNWYNYGVVPILYDDKEAELVLAWDNENPDGYVAGWRYTYMGFGSQKGLFDVSDGMYFDFLCDYYTYDNEYDDQYLFGGMTAKGPITVSYEDVGDGDCLVYYALYDVFNNTYWTEPLVFSLDD